MGESDPHEMPKAAMAPAMAATLSMTQDLHNDLFAAIMVPPAQARNIGRCRDQ